MGEWIEWYGGNCPLKPGIKRIEVNLRCFAIYETDHGAHLRWSHKELGGDIMSYRVVSEDIPEVTEEVILHSHYKKDTRHLDMIDVYRVLDLWEVTDPCVQHALKKLLVAGGRGAGKDVSQDIQEAIDSLERWKIMQEENKK